MLTIYKFSTSTCNPCKSLLPMFNKLSVENPQVNFVSIELDTELDDNKNIIADKFVIKTVPTVIALCDGVEVFRKTGADLTGKSYQNMINEYA